MIIRIIGYDNDIDFTKSNVYTLEILRKDVFLKVCTDIYYLSNNIIDSNDYIMITNDSVEKFNRNVFMIDSIFGFDINEKKYLNKLYNYVEEIMNISIDKKREFETSIMSINRLIQELLIDLDIDFLNNDEIKISNYLKLINLTFDNTSGNDVLGNIYMLIDIVSEFNLCKLLIFINLRNFFNDKEIEELYKYIIYKNIYLLDIENISYDILKYERKLIIDLDLIDFIV